MTKRRITLAALAAVLASGGSAAAIAATSKDEAKQAESAILSDAAKRLDTSPEKLRAALAAAQDTELDRAVKAGRLTQEQADAIKTRRAQSGSVLGRGPHGGPGDRGRHGGPGGRGRGPGHGGPHRAIIGDIAADAAKALGLKDAPALFERLRDGKTLADIAKAENKDLDGVKATIKASATERLAAAVKDGTLTDKRRDRIVARLDRLIDRFATGRPGKFGPRGPGRGGPDGPGKLGPGGARGGDPDDGPRNENGALPVPAPEDAQVS